MDHPSQHDEPPSQSTDAPDTPGVPNTPDAPGTPRRRIRYTPKLKLKLIQLCIENGGQFLEARSEDDFWRFIRTLFAEMSGLEPGDGVRYGAKLQV